MSDTPISNEVANAVQAPIEIPYGTPLKAATNLYIEKVLVRLNGNKTHAAKALGITRSALYARLAGKVEPTAEG